MKRRLLLLGSSNNQVLAGSVLSLGYDPLCRADILHCIVGSNRRVVRVVSAEFRHVTVVMCSQKNENPILLVHT